MSIDVSLDLNTTERIHSVQYRILEVMNVGIIGSLTPFAISFFFPWIWRLPIWIALIACIAWWWKRIAAVSLRIGSTGVLIQNFYRRYEVRWEEVKSVEVEPDSVFEVATGVVVLETRTRGRVFAWGSALDGLMPALAALIPLVERHGIPLEMAEKTRREYDRYSEKLIAAR
jgi:hypothetical protein